MKKIVFLIITMLLITGCSHQVITEESDNINVSVTSGESLDVSIQDYTGELQSYFLINIIHTDDILENLSIYDNTVYVGDTKFCIVGDAINIYNGYDLFQAKIDSMNSTHFKVTPVIDKNFKANESYYECGPTNMGVLGSISSPVIYSIHPPEKVNWQIKTNIVNFIDDQPMDSTEFGSQLPLTNGLLIRTEDGIFKNLFMIYNNNGFIIRGFDYLSIPKAPSGSYYQSFKLNLEDVYGTLIQLNGSSKDMFQYVVSDDLRSQERIVSSIGGHLTTE